MSGSALPAHFDSPEAFERMRNMWNGQATVTAQTFRAIGRQHPDFENWRRTFLDTQARFVDLDRDDLLLMLVANAELIAAAAEIMTGMSEGDAYPLIEIPVALRPHPYPPAGGTA